MSNFPFVSDQVLKTNLDVVFDHIVDLLTLSESTQYKGKELLVSSLRKTIIIHTASIIEALLLWKLKKHITANKIQLSNEWKYYDIKILHDLGNSEQIIAGKRKQEEKTMDKLDFLRIADYCYNHKVYTSLKLNKDIHKVRELRNKLHIGGLKDLEKEYTKADIEFCFNVAKRVKDICRK